MAFWIDEAAESAALGITTLLCTLALRDSLSLPDVSEFTWVELFMLMNVLFQGLVLLLSFIDYSEQCTKEWGKVYFLIIKVHDKIITSLLPSCKAALKRYRQESNAANQQVKRNSPFFGRAEGADTASRKPTEVEVKVEPPAGVEVEGVEAEGGLEDAQEWIEGPSPGVLFRGESWSPAPNKNGNAEEDLKDEDYDGLQPPTVDVVGRLGTQLQGRELWGKGEGRVRVGGRERGGRRTHARLHQPPSAPLRTHCSLAAHLQPSAN